MTILMILWAIIVWLFRIGGLEILANVLKIKMVGDTGFEPVTSTVCRKYRIPEKVTLSYCYDLQ